MLDSVAKFCETAATPQDNADGGGAGTQVLQTTTLDLAAMARQILSAGWQPPPPAALADDDERDALLRDIAARARSLPLHGWVFLVDDELHDIESAADALADDTDALIWLLYAQPGDTWCGVECIDLDAERAEALS